MRYILSNTPQNKTPSVTVLTPSVGSKKLIDCMESVTGQTYQNLRHFVVYDGKNEYPYRYGHTRLDTCHLPYNTGGDGFYGHKIYATFPKLINSDIIFFLDEDNWFEQDHVESLVDVLLENPAAEFAFSLRKIYDADKKYLLDDNCESLGKYPVWCNQDSYLVDTSSYAFRTSFIKRTCHHWEWGWGADRRYYNIAKTFTSICSGKHTLAYRLDGNPNSVNEDFFKQGNEVYHKKYSGVYPWLK